MVLPVDGSDIMRCPIRNKGLISSEFLGRNIRTFGEACAFVKELPYGRNGRKEDPMVVLQEACGTCSTKHGLLQRLAIENEIQASDLVLGIFKMDGENEPAVAGILGKLGLPYLPEAHCYLKIHGKIWDFTFPAFEIPHLEARLMLEQKIMPEQCGDGKNTIHKDFLGKWLAANPEFSFSVADVWQAREECIQAFSEANKDN
jgi:hypothetical protein